ncbi:MAG: SDH family Clp fold serine proteinase [Solirubrobacteraceae bacterium]
MEQGIDMARAPLVYDRVLEEVGQGHATRKELFKQLEVHLEPPVVSVFTSFRYPVMLQDDDADMLEGVLQSLDLSKGLALVISSPGGDGLAAERIVNMCRSYSGTGEFWAIVPGKAKSAATIVCFGASKITMGPTSELGPVDPQLNEGQNVFSVYNLVASYEDLFQRAVNDTSGNMHPYLQQLEHYDEREIAEMRAAIELSKDIAARLLGSGMMGSKSGKAITSKIKMFLTPEQTKAHGRPIYRDEAAKCGLNIERAEPDSDYWSAVYALYIRSNNLVQTAASKCIESAEHSYTAGAQ